MKFATPFLLMFMLFSLLLLSSCDKEECRPEYFIRYEFQGGADGWTGDFTDYPLGEEEFYEIDFRHDHLPAPLDTTEGALVLTGHNHSDDLFMYIKTKVDNLLPERRYAVSAVVRFASDVPDGTVGIGGSPGEGVYLKFGAATEEPMRMLNPADNHWQLNLDKGNQAQGGDDVVLMGDFANGTDEWEYVLLQRRSPQPLTVTTDEDGQLWVFFGSDSGFEGLTKLYIDGIDLEFELLP